MEQATKRGGSAGIGFAVAVILIWILRDYGSITVPEEAAAAITTVVTFIVQDLTRRLG